MANPMFWPSVVVPLPAHRAVAEQLSYTHDRMLAPGTLVRVPLGHRDVPGVVWDCPTEPPPGLSPELMRPVSSVLAAEYPVAHPDGLCRPLLPARPG
jgi:primosomal protein N' (replication factor Y)